MTIYGITVDTSKGFDVMRGSKVLKHFERYEDACTYAAAGRNRCVRYWGVKGS